MNSFWAAPCVNVTQLSDHLEQMLSQIISYHVHIIICTADHSKYISKLLETEIQNNAGIVKYMNIYM